MNKKLRDIHEPELPESQATTSKAANKKSVFKNNGKSGKK